MTTHPATRLALAAMFAALTLPAAAAPATPLGTWLTESGNLEVRIDACGQALCGTVTKVIANNSMSQAGDMKPVDPRPALGMTILIDLKPQGEGEWKGSIYNRENGKTYDALVSVPAADQLAMRGYVGLPLFGKTQIWRRVAAPKP
jgi:uncharacterized protein (DUF2147 family)